MVQVLHSIEKHSCDHNILVSKHGDNINDCYEPSQQRDWISFTADVLETVRIGAAWKERRFELDSDMLVCYRSKDVVKGSRGIVASVVVPGATVSYRGVNRGKHIVLVRCPVSNHVLIMSVSESSSHFWVWMEMLAKLTASAQCAVAESFAIEGNVEWVRTDGSALSVENVYGVVKDGRMRLYTSRADYFHGQRPLARTTLAGFTMTETAVAEAGQFVLSISDSAAGVEYLLSFPDMVQQLAWVYALESAADSPLF